MAKRNPRKERKVAKERIEELFQQADEVFSEEPDLAHRYTDMARKIAMKYKIRIPGKLQRKFCKHCYKYLRPGVNLRVRTTDGKVTYTCLECKGQMRFPYKKEQKERRKRNK